MTARTQALDPRLASILSLFPGSSLANARYEVLDGNLVPEPYKSLLVHRHHMTVTLEDHYHSPVRLHVLERRLQGDDYARRLKLSIEPGELTVMVGLMRFHLQHSKEEVRNAILSEGAPLGRILIENKVLRWIEPHLYLRVELDDDLREQFRAPPTARYAHGRVAHIICHNAPAVELLEIVRP